MEEEEQEEDSRHEDLGVWAGAGAVVGAMTEVKTGKDIIGDVEEEEEEREQMFDDEMCVGSGWTSS